MLAWIRDSETQPLKKKLAEHLSWAEMRRSGFACALVCVPIHRHTAAQCDRVVRQRLTTGGCAQVHIEQR